MATERRLIAFDPITFESFARHATKHREPDACQYDMEKQFHFGHSFALFFSLYQVLPATATFLLLGGGKSRFLGIFTSFCP